MALDRYSVVARSPTALTCYSAATHSTCCQQPPADSLLLQEDAATHLVVLARVVSEPVVIVNARVAVRDQLPRPPRRLRRYKRSCKKKSRFVPHCLNGVAANPCSMLIAAGAQACARGWPDNLRHERHSSSVEQPSPCVCSQVPRHVEVGRITHQDVPPRARRSPRPPRAGRPPPCAGSSAFPRPGRLASARPRNSLQCKQITGKKTPVALV